MNILITGGTGLIGQTLIPAFLQHGHSVWVLTRRPETAKLPGGVQAVRWDGRTTEGWGELVAEMDAVLNLAGENIGALPWNNARKQALRSSRALAGQAVTDAVCQNPQRVRVILQVSGVGYYGISDERTFTEQSPQGDDFVASICTDWEGATRPVEDLGVRRVITRLGVVLDPQGGALARFVYAWRMFLGGPMGSGRQWISWVHPQDVVQGMRFLIEREDAIGAFNLTSPNPVRNAEFGRTLAEVMDKPYKLPIPGFAIKALYGEMSTMVLDGQRVLPERLLALGFTFQYPDLRDALTDILKEETPVLAG